MNAKQRIPEEQLTAYVMGELSGDELRLFETALSEDPTLKAEAEALRGFCGQLWNELAAEPGPSMSRAERRAFSQRLDTAALTARPKKVAWHRWIAVAAPLAVAAAAAVIVYPKVKDAPLSVVLPKVASNESASEVRYVPAPAEADVAAVDADKKAQAAADESAAGKDDELAKAEAEMAPPPAARATKPTPSVAQPTSGRANGVNLSQLGLGVGKLAGPAKNKGLAGQGSGAVLLADKRSRPMREKKIGPMSAEPGTAFDGEGDPGFNTEAYDLIQDNPFKTCAVDPLSTFSVDVDTASYANVRRFIASGTLPPKDAVRIEELLNYFRYDYVEPSADRPFSVNVEVTTAPWQAKHRLVRIGLKGKDIAWGDRPAANLVFLIDVSGSMDEPNKLPLVKQALKLMIDELDGKDRVAIAVYAGAAGLVLPSTSASDKQTILDALERLQAGGSTNGGEGIELAYATATKHFVKGGLNRVVIATDGDFNVGTTSQGDLLRVIEKKAKSGVFLSVLGFGMGNYKDSTLEKLADKGNGNYAYIDSANEAKKALVEEIGGTLVTIAKDVKLQLEFNPEEVTAYRLIGYENRVLAHQDFNDDLKDAGDIGAGHVVTALYEVVPKGVAFSAPGVDPLKYQKPAASSSGSGDLLTLKLRFKQPEGAKSSLIEYAVKDKGLTLDEASPDTRFAAGVAAFGMVLRDSEHKGSATLDLALGLVEPAIGKDDGGYRREFAEMIRKAKSLRRP